MTTNIDVNYRYEHLLKAIDFFTQKFSLDQLSTYAFKFSNELLELNSSALFIKDNDEFKLKITKSYQFEEYSIKNSLKLQNIATFHGNVIISHFESFFESEPIDRFKPSIVIPLIIDEFLYGFIISSGKIDSDFDEDDYTICYSLMRLINNALENIKHMMDLKYKNKELDQKIFNLFAINHSSKTLLSELDLQSLYSIATDIFSEITTSKVTSFGIYDEISKSINIFGYRNISNFSRYYSKLKLHTNKYKYSKVVLNMDLDLELIKSIFVNWKELYNLNTKYVVLLVKDTILGLVTLSDPVNESNYDKSTFELIESLSSFAYIALSNALLFEELRIKKEITEKKLNILSKLNKLIKNINHCINIDELCSLTLKTLNISFGIKKGFISFIENDIYKIKYSTGLNLENIYFNINDHWDDTFLGETLYSFSSEDISNYFDYNLINSFGDTNCIVISPIILENSFLYDTKYPIGYLVILETKNSLKEEELLLIDTICQNISPIIHQMNMVSSLKQNYIEDPKNKFLNILQNKINDKDKYLIDFNLYYSKIQKHPFKALELGLFNEFEYYLVDNYIFIISYDYLDLINFNKIENISCIEDVLDFDYK